MAFHFPLEAILRLRRGQERMERLKLEAIASELEAVILRPYYPVSGLFRISRDIDGLQLDFRKHAPPRSMCYGAC